ncbi:SAM-dependent methyltransferase [Capsulimonas corticalis]|uniref:SAM-dependent methyltransferase n=1 Tax=Capsulimonas corticalis TaxID=2219043 RepID=A0A402D391_9BACT|nr:class I SAM-dependent methyltransferase [Capsulimonas corticalis]BDI28546.1 SAM-dependent methyltransferase [Capsulimonas corticalis]
MTNDTTLSRPDVNIQRLAQIFWGFAPSLIVETGVRLRIFDILDSGAKTIAEVAEETAASERGLRSLLNALTGLGLLAKTSRERYSLTPESETFLVSTRPGYHGGFIRQVRDSFIPTWMDLAEVVQTGKPRAASMNAEKGGVEFFQNFVEDLFPVSYAAAQAFARSLNLSTRRQTTYALDIACGSGVWGIALAQESEHVRVTGVDWPGVLPVTRRTTEKFHVADQFEFIGGDILEADFGAGYEVATLGHILHSEGEARSRELLKKVYTALAPGGTIAIADMLPNEERTGPPFPLIFSLVMLLGTDAGDTYTFEEIQQWLTEAGFVEARTMPSPSVSPLIVARKPFGA